MLRLHIFVYFYLIPDLRTLLCRDTELNSLGLQLSDLRVQLISPPLQLCQLLRWAEFSSVWHLKLTGGNQRSTIITLHWFCVCVCARACGRIFTYRWFEVGLNSPEPGERSSRETGQEQERDCPRKNMLNIILFINVWVLNTKYYKRPASLCLHSMSKFKTSSSQLW